MKKSGFRLLLIVFLIIAVGGYANPVTVSGSMDTVTVSAVPTTQTAPIATSIPDQVPIAHFTANKTSGRVPFSVKFSDTSYLSPTNWSWIFGDGNVSHEMNPVHTYVTPGTYSVKLIASNKAGSNTVTRIYYITVMPEFQAPIAALGIRPQEPLSDTIQFVDQSNGPATNWSWDFGDGVKSVLQNPVHTYSSPGNYLVTLTISNPLGRSSSMKFLTLGGAPGTSTSSSSSSSPASNLGNFIGNGGYQYQQNW